MILLNNESVYRGDIWLADLTGASAGVEQGGSKKPVIILQNDIGNRYSPSVIVAVVTSSKTKKEIPTHVYLDAVKNGLEKDSVALLEQIKTIDRYRLLRKLTTICDEDMKKVESTLLFSLGFGSN